MCAALLLWTLTARAHDFWIEPDLFRAETGQRIDIALRIGENLSGDSLPFVPQWFVDYRIITPDGPRPVDAIIGDVPAGHFVPEQEGLYLIGHQSTADFVDMEAQKFNDYLESEGLGQIIAMREETGTTNDNGREYYSRYAKALVKVGSGTPDDAYSTVIGYTLELTPLNNPYALQTEDTLKLQLNYLGEPIEGITVIAFNNKTPEQTQRSITNADGQAEVRIDSPGVWLIKAIHMIPRDPADNADAADWESYWASLTFRH